MVIILLFTASNMQYASLPLLYKDWIVSFTISTLNRAEFLYCTDSKKLSIECYYHKGLLFGRLVLSPMVIKRLES